MKLSFYIFTISLFASCNQIAENQQTVPDHQYTEKQKLRQLFDEWQKNEIAEGRLWAADSCYPGWFVDHPHDGEMIQDTWGLPDSSEYSYSYADLNSDGKLDQLVTFTPSQCDGGNASMWIQIEVFTVSVRDTFETTTKLGDGLFSLFDGDTSGFYFYDSIGVNKIYGTFYSFQEGDGHCCPGIMKPVIFAYDTKALIYKGENIAEKERIP